MDYENTIYQDKETQNTKCCGIGIFKIDTETIGQYTGLKDKNGKEIFEGDIILTQPLRTKPFSKNYKSKRLKGIVQYEVKSFRSFPNRMYTAGWDVEIIDKESFKKYRCWDWGLFLDCEVIRKYLR